MLRYLALCLSTLLSPTLLGQPQLTHASEPPPIPMPADRATDSYRIYSMLLPVGELGAQGWPKDLYLLQDTTTTMVPSDQPCSAPSSGGNLHPHSALHAPPDRRQDLRELLDDFDRHCHERIRLTSDGFHLSVPLLLLDEAQQKEFESTRFSAKPDPKLAAKYKGAPGLSSFSQVYFNAHHTVAMVFAYGWCGAECGQGFWSVYELQTGQWNPLRWNSVMVMS